MTLNKNAMIRCYPVTPFSKSHAVTQSRHVVCASLEKVLGQAKRQSRAE